MTEAELRNRKPTNSHIVRISHPNRARKFENGWSGSISWQPDELNDRFLTYLNMAVRPAKR